MLDLALARAIHVVAIVLWIGGVGMVTTVLLPAIRRDYPPEERFRVFHALERRFAIQARATTLAAGASGFYMTWRLDAWARFHSPDDWWMTAMVLVWLAFSLMLFAIEPLFLDRFLERRAATAPAATFRAVERLHYGLLGASLLTVAGAVAGTQGVNLLGR